MSVTRMPREASLQASVESFLRAQHGCTFRKNHVIYGVRGDPDIYGCFQGRMFHLELKQPGKKPRPDQRLRLAEWEQAGAKTAVIHSMDELRLFWADFTGGIERQ